MATFANPPSSSAPFAAPSATGADRQAASRGVTSDLTKLMAKFSLDGSASGARDYEPLSLALASDDELEIVAFNVAMLNGLRVRKPQDGDARSARHAAEGQGSWMFDPAAVHDRMVKSIHRASHATLDNGFSTGDMMPRDMWMLPDSFELASQISRIENRIATATRDSVLSTMPSGPFSRFEKTLGIKRTANEAYIMATESISVELMEHVPQFGGARGNPVTHKRMGRRPIHRWQNSVVMPLNYLRDPTLKDHINTRVEWMYECLTSTLCVEVLQSLVDVGMDYWETKGTRALPCATMAELSRRLDELFSTAMLGLKAAAGYSVMLDEITRAFTREGADITHMFTAEEVGTQIQWRPVLSSGQLARGGDIPKAPVEVTLFPPVVFQGSRYQPLERKFKLAHSVSISYSLATGRSDFDENFHSSMERTRAYNSVDNSTTTLKLQEAVLKSGLFDASDSGSLESDFPTYGENGPGAMLLASILAYRAGATRSEHETSKSTLVGVVRRAAEFQAQVRDGLAQAPVQPYQQGGLRGLVPIPNLRGFAPQPHYGGANNVGAGGRFGHAYIFVPEFNFQELAVRTETVNSWNRKMRAMARSDWIELLNDISQNRAALANLLPQGSARDAFNNDTGALERLLAYARGRVQVGGGNPALEAFYNLLVAQQRDNNINRPGLAPAAGALLDPQANLRAALAAYAAAGGNAPANDVLAGWLDYLRQRAGRNANLQQAAVAFDPSSLSNDELELARRCMYVRKRIIRLCGSLNLPLPFSALLVRNFSMRSAGYLAVAGGEKTGALIIDEHRMIVQQKPEGGGRAELIHQATLCSFPAVDARRVMIQPFGEPIALTGQVTSRMWHMIADKPNIDHTNHNHICWKPYLVPWNFAPAKYTAIYGRFQASVLNDDAAAQDLSNTFPTAEVYKEWFNVQNNLTEDASHIFSRAYYDDNDLSQINIAVRSYHEVCVGNDRWEVREGSDIFGPRQSTEAWRMIHGRPGIFDGNILGAGSIFNAIATNSRSIGR